MSHGILYHCFIAQICQWPHVHSLKHLGNIRKRPMSANIMKDMLGVDGQMVLKDIGKVRKKALAKEDRKLEMIVLAVRYFDARMKKRRDLLVESIERSKNNSYNKPVHDWKTAYDRIKVAAMNN